MGSGWDAGGPAFYVAWPALLLLSLYCFRFDERLAIFGVISCIVTAYIALFVPVLAI
jgi:hypothetical protein